MAFLKRYVVQCDACDAEIEVRARSHATANMRVREADWTVMHDDGTSEHTVHWCPAHSETVSDN